MPTKFYLFKRANGVYYLGYLEAGCKRWKSTGQKTKAEALKILQDFEEHLQKKLPGLTFEQFVEQFKRLQANSLRSSTLKGIYGPAFDSFQRIAGNIPMRLYTLSDVEKFKAVRLEEIEPTTVNIQFRALRAAFNHAIKWQIIRKNPFMESSQVKVAEVLPLYLTREDFQNLLKVTKEQVLKDVFLIAVFTGMRLGEIINLQWPAVDLKRKQITVVNTATFQTKTGRVRVLPMNDAVYQMLLRRTTSKGWRDYVFHRGTYPLLLHHCSKKFKAYAKAAGLNKALHFHSLRHTHATWLVQSGANIYQVQKLLGHSSVKTSEVYSHLAASELGEVVSKIGFN